MGNGNTILGIDLKKIDNDDIMALLVAYRDPSKILLHVGLIEKIYEFSQGKNSETKQLSEIVKNAILHCVIAKENPTFNTFDPSTGESTYGPEIYNQAYIDHVTLILPALENINNRLLTVLDGQQS